MCIQYETERFRDKKRFVALRGWFFAWARLALLNASQ
jgi:hypothetical protein